MRNPLNDYEPGTIGLAGIELKLDRYVDVNEFLGDMTCLTNAYSKKFAGNFFSSSFYLRLVFKSLL